LKKFREFSRIQEYAKTSEELGRKLDEAVKMR